MLCQFCNRDVENVEQASTVHAEVPGDDAGHDDRIIAISAYRACQDCLTVMKYFVIKGILAFRKNLSEVSQFDMFPGDSFTSRDSS